jgi:hypothetical protein
MLKALNTAVGIATFKLTSRLAYGLAILIGDQGGNSAEWCLWEFHNDEVDVDFQDSSM